ncbi:hypothetical protein IKT18_03900 [Candidatus Saccharibacteria bacterium]|nr:hypothetical protein [Candidatus Saccharibacteria bacterium]
MLFAGMTTIFSTPVSAIGEDDATVQEEQVESDEQPEETEEGEEESEEPAKEERKTSTRPQASCENSLGAIGWLVCPTTGKLAEAVDWLYDKIEEFLIINPVEIKDGSPIYEIWKYMRGVTNIVFIIFLLVVVYSQITGLGITNYGIKKVLPKLIVAAVLMNLSFIICSLAVDLSNIIGSSLRGVFTAVEESTIGTMAIDSGQGMYVTMADAYSSLAGGTMLAVGGGFVAFETGAIWMAIPAAIGAIIAVVVGLLTIALRQAVVALLIMVSPLAIVAYMLPNTEEWFTKWKKLLIRMLVFYPVFSLLFGASSLAGFAIIASAVARSDGFMLIVGLVVQVFPLFFAWSLMKMSGTVLGTINTKLRGLAAKPLASTRGWAESRRESTKMKHLASNNVYTPSLYLRQYLNDRKIHREEEMKENAETVKNRGLAYDARKHYKNFDKSILNDDGKNAYADQARNAEYQNVLIRHKANMNRGFGWALEAGSNEWREISELDKANVRAFDRMKQEQARAEKIDLDNTKGYHTRMETAMNAHMDKLHWDKTNKEGKLDYERHFESQETTDFKDALNRYSDISKVMDDNAADVQYAAAYAAHAYDTQNKIIQNKFQKYFELVPPTRDVRYRLEELSRLTEMNPDGTFKTRAVDNIDTIISGLKVLNQRGDTDFVKDILDDIWDSKYGGLELGTHASQAIASFLMFDVKDNDPYLRRFGKYINLETARRFDHNERQKETVDYDEYVRGYHVEPDGTIMHAKKDIVILMEGTSLDGVERTAFDNYDSSLRKVYTDSEGKVDIEAYEERRKEIDKATGPQFISANLKYLSGSEQIVSAVKSKTGFAAVQDKTTGKYNMVPIWDDPREDEKLFKNYSDEEKAEAKKGLKEFYRVQTLKYLKDQTPAQILGLRSDYKEPILEHLSASYLLDEEGNLDPEKFGMHEQELLEIENDDFGEVDPDKIDEKRKKTKEALRVREAREELLEILYRLGKLEQIDKSKRSGAGNNAKDWVRELLLLDTNSGLREWINDRNRREAASSGSEVNDMLAANAPNEENRTIDNEDSQKKTITPKSPSQREKQNSIEQQVKREQQREQLKKMLKELKEQQRREADPNLTPDKQNLSVYTSADIADFTTHIDDLWYDMRDNDDEDGQEEFFKATRDYVAEAIGSESYVVKMYEKYYNDNPDGDMYELYKFLIDLVESLLND